MQSLPTIYPTLQTATLRNLPPWQRQLQARRVTHVPFRARIVHYLISRDITVFTFDFAGCGLSEGEYISLGFYERGDVDCVFRYLRELGTVSSIGIWGRSMGAVTALMYADSNHEIGCLVLDSPFSNLEKLSKELAEKHGGGLSIFSGIALSFLKSTIKDKVIRSIRSITLTSRI